MQALLVGTDLVEALTAALNWSAECNGHRYLRASKCQLSTLLN